MDSEQKENRKEKKGKRHGKEEKKKYKGYEELLEIEDEVLDDEELPNPNGCYNISLIMLMYQETNACRCCS